jgi:hypothetical protein
MSLFFQSAKKLAEKGVPVIRLRPNSKIAFDREWPNLATTDLEILKKWAEETPNANCGAVASNGGIWMLEVDSPDVVARIQKETGHDITAIQTYKIRSRPGRGHFYFKSTPASDAMGNIAQTYVLGQDFSCRVKNSYCVGSGSLHPDTGLPYIALNDAPIIEAPQWLIDWLLSQKIQKHSAPQGAQGRDLIRNENGRISHGGIHNWMLTQAGKLRAMGLDANSIETPLLALVHANCEPPIDENKVRQMAKSICNFPVGAPVSSSLALTQSQVVGPPQEPEEELSFEEIEYPLFPKWVMHGTSLYEGFAKPYCAQNSRIDYFMWAPAAAMMMNYLGNKVSVPLKGWKPSLYLVLIGKPGKANKSSSIKDGFKFFEFAAALSNYSREIKNAEGKSVVFEAGSPEGLGTDMQRINCKNAILFYDELSALVSKASIEGSGLNSALLKMYESGNFGNSIKSKKDAFSIMPDSYVASLITATTDKKFSELWSQLAGEDTGLNERFTFLLQPETLPEAKIHTAVSYHEAALATRKLLDKAVAKGSYEFYDQTPFVEALKKFKNREVIRAEKWSLYFAIDLGLDEIDEDCVERGIALTKYEAEVKKYLMTFDAKNDESKIQQSIIRYLKKRHGVAKLRDLERALSSNTYGTTLWDRAFLGLYKSGYILVEGQGSKGDPKRVRMLRDMSFGEDDD